MKYDRTTITPIPEVTWRKLYEGVSHDPTDTGFWYITHGGVTIQTTRWGRYKAKWRSRLRRARDAWAVYREEKEAVDPEYADDRW